MSKIGKLPIALSSEIKPNIAGGILHIAGPKGKLEQKLHSDVNVVIEDGFIKVVPNNKEQQTIALWGLYRSLINNMVQGVKEGYSVNLEINGTGYKAAVADKFLVLALGHSHDIFVEIEDGLDVSVQKNIITVAGVSKQRVGQFAAVVRSLRKPEPYKGKGVKYVTEKIRRKEGKKK